jgi:hypothetical protein
LLTGLPLALSSKLELNILADTDTLNRAVAEMMESRLDCRTGRI